MSTGEGAALALEDENRRLRHLLQHSWNAIFAMHAYLKSTPEEQAAAKRDNIFAIWNEAWDMLRTELWHPDSPAPEFHAQLHPHSKPHDDHDRWHDPHLFSGGVS